MKRELKEQLSDIWPLFPAAIFLLFFLSIVLIYLVNISFSFEGTFPSFDPFTAVISSPKFKAALINTIIFVAIGTPLELIMGLILAFLVYKAYWGRSLIRSLFVVPFAFPGLVIATLLFILFDSQGGFVNHMLQGEYPPFPSILKEDINWRGSTFFAVGLSLMGKVWRDMPISMLIILSGLNSIEPELLDAGKTLGAGFRVRISKILLPLIFPAMTTVLLLRSVEMWKEFIFPYVLAGNNQLLGTLIESFYVSFAGQRESEAAVVALFLVFLIVVTLLIILSVMNRLKKMVVDGGGE
jgi:ABC-type sugar transport system permease subunit